MLDFGPADQWHPEAFSAPAKSRAYEGSWVGLVRNGTAAPPADNFIRDYVEGEDATFLLGVRPGAYRVRLILGDIEAARGPVTVHINDRLVASDVRTGAGEVIQVDKDVNAREGELRFHLRAEDCGAFSLIGLALYCPVADSTRVRAASILRPIFSKLDSLQGEGPRRLFGDDARRAARQTLRQCCDYFVQWKLPETGFSYRGNWYENSYALRTLLSGYEIFKDKAYRETAFECLDRFVDEQLPSGNWSSQYFGYQGCPLAKAQLENPSSSNLADIGTMALCLSLASKYADAPRRKSYLDAAQTYADKIVLPNQMESGAFPNLMFAGVHYLYPYSVATGVQAANLSALYAVTRDRRYLQAAQRAAQFLTANVEADGTIRFFGHDAPEPSRLDAYEVANTFYILEGLLWSYSYSDPPVREVIRAALDQYFHGQNGLVSRLHGHRWWYGREGSWEESKRSGLLYLWNLYAEISGQSEADSEFLASLLACLVAPACALMHGVLFHPAAPWGEFAPAATGWAGLSLASCLDTSLLYPDTHKAEGR